MPNLGKKKPQRVLDAISWWSYGERTFLRAISCLFVYFYLANAADIRLGKKASFWEPAVCKEENLHFVPDIWESPSSISADAIFAILGFCGHSPQISRKEKKQRFLKFDLLLSSVLFCFLREFYDFERKGEIFQLLFFGSFFPDLWHFLAKDPKHLISPIRFSFPSKKKKNNSSTISLIVFFLSFSFRANRLDQLQSQSEAKAITSDAFKRKRERKGIFASFRLAFSHFLLAKKTTFFLSFPASADGNGGFCRRKKSLKKENDNFPRCFSFGQGKKSTVSPFPWTNRQQGRRLPRS